MLLPVKFNSIDQSMIGQVQDTSGRDDSSADELAQQFDVSVSFPLDQVTMQRIVIDPQCSSMVVSYSDDLQVKYEPLQKRINGRRVVVAGSAP